MLNLVSGNPIVWFTGGGGTSAITAVVTPKVRDIVKIALNTDFLFILLFSLYIFFAAVVKCVFLTSTDEHLLNQSHVV